MNIISKQYFTFLFSPAREKVFTLKNIKAGLASVVQMSGTPVVEDEIVPEP